MVARGETGYVETGCCAVRGVHGGLLRAIHRKTYSLKIGAAPSIDRMWYVSEVMREEGLRLLGERQRSIPRHLSHALDSSKLPGFLDSTQCTG